MRGGERSREEVSGGERWSRGVNENPSPLLYLDHRARLPTARGSSLIVLLIDASRTRRAVHGLHIRTDLHLQILC